ncbi:MAG: hypothetical protein AAB037_01185 [Chloroflexota bacterium]
MGSLTDIKGIAVGHWADTEAVTGCTGVLCPEGAVVGWGCTWFGTGHQG